MSDWRVRWPSGRRYLLGIPEVYFYLPWVYVAFSNIGYMYHPVVELQAGKNSMSKRGKFVGFVSARPTNRNVNAVRQAAVQTADSPTEP